MPTAPKSFRASPTRKDRDKVRGTKQQRGYGGEWERISKMKRDESPICEVCGDAAATQVDHIIPFTDANDPRRTQWSNLQSICNACHSWKSNVANNEVARVYVVCGEPGTGKSTFCQRFRPSTAALFDLDIIAEAMNAGWRKNDNRPVEVNALIGDWREVLVNRIAGSKFLTQCWIIIADKEKAERIAERLSARLVTCSRIGDTFSHTNVSYDVRALEPQSRQTYQHLPSPR